MSAVGGRVKGVVADDARGLVTLANFTDRAQRRTLVAGVLVEPARFPERLAAPWHAVTAAGWIRAVRPIPL